MMPSEYYQVKSEVNSISNQFLPTKTIVNDTFSMSSHMIPTRSHRRHIWASDLPCLVVLGHNKAGE